MKVVEITVTLDVPASEYRSRADAAASMLAEVGGLSATMFFLNPDAGIAAGLCVFELEHARDDFLAGPVLRRLREAPFQRRLEIRLFDLMPPSVPMFPATGESFCPP